MCGTSAKLILHRRRILSAYLLHRVIGRSRFEQIRSADDERRWHSANEKFYAPTCNRQIGLTLRNLLLATANLRDSQLFRDSRDSATNKALDAIKVFRSLDFLNG